MKQFIKLGLTCFLLIETLDDLTIMQMTNIVNTSLNIIFPSKGHQCLQMKDSSRYSTVLPLKDQPC